METLTTSSLKVDPDELLAHMLAAGALTDHDLELMSQVRAVIVIVIVVVIVQHCS